MIKKIITSIIASGLLFTGQTVFADDTPAKARWYQVNITVFKQKNSHATNETFSTQPIELAEADLIQLKAAPKKGVANSAFNAPLALTQEAVNHHAPYLHQNIDKDWGDVLSHLDPASQPILYNMQWLQPIYHKDHSVPLYFEGSTGHLGLPQIRGLIHLNVARYLHSTFNINYWPETAETPEELVSLTQSRRMRSKEVHYLDHPMVGVLIRLLPAKSPLERQKGKGPAQTAKI